jgi:hypothetical protein
MFAKDPGHAGAGAAFVDPPVSADTVSRSADLTAKVAWKFFGAAGYRPRLLCEKFAYPLYTFEEAFFLNALQDQRLRATAEITKEALGNGGESQQAGTDP